MNSEEKKENKDEGKLIRITKEADDALSGLMQRLNDDDAIAKVSKLDLASFVLARFCPGISNDDLRELQLKLLSEVDLLKLAYKRALASGTIPENLREILYLNAGLTPEAKKAKKSRQHNGSNATHEDKEAG